MRPGVGAMGGLYTLENMPVTINDLLEMKRLALDLVAGKEGVARPIRWAHVSELVDPTPWLSGGELLLTTGMGLNGPASAQRAYLERLIAAKVAGLGLGVGFGLDAVPRPLVEVADANGFPIVEVPYPVPFIAITEAVSSRLSADRLREAQMSVEVHERLSAMVTAGADFRGVLEEVVALAPGWASLFDLRGGVLAMAADRSVEPPPAREVWDALPPGFVAGRGPATAGQTSPRGTSVALVVGAGDRAHAEAVLVFGKPKRLDQRDRIVVHHAVAVLGLLLAARRAVVETERRIAGDVLSEAFGGRLEGPELVRRLELVGFPADVVVAVLVVEAGGVKAARMDDLAWSLDAAVGARSKAARVGVVNDRVAAVVVHPDPEELAATLASELDVSSEGGAAPVRIAVGEAVTLADIRRSYVSAVLALRAAGDDKRIVSPRDLGSYGFLLAAQPSGALDGFVRAVLGPLIDRDRTRSSDLVDSVRAFIEAGGRWEQGAEALDVHRHTLRYRVRQAEEILGRDLSEAQDRLEVWLALKAEEVLRE